MINTLKIPMTQRSAFDESQKGYYLSALSALKSKFGFIIDEYCSDDFCNVPKELVYSTMLIENDKGLSDFVSSAGAVGVKQIKPLSATDIIITENKAKRLTDTEKKEFTRILGKAKADRIFKAALGQQIVTASDLKKPDLNILIGTIYLSTLLAEHSNRFDLVGFRYNQGYYVKVSGKSAKSFTGTTSELLAQTSGEGRNYIIKLVGKNGMLDFIV